MENTEIVNKINSFSRWHYQFNLKGHLTPIFDKQLINRHQERKRYFFDPLVQFLGGSLSGKRILDLGCNAGFWALHAIDHGCDYVLGVDGRQMHIDQSNFVFEASNVEKKRYDFIQENIFDLDFTRYGTFDIIFCLGLMYHISKPMVLMEKISAVNSDILLIDTCLSMARGSFLQLVHEPVDDPRNAIDYELVFHPTRKAVLEIVRQFGYSTIILKPQFQDYLGAEVYQKGSRRAFICSKRGNLDNFPAEKEPVDLPTQKESGLLGVFRPLVHSLRKRFLH